MSVVGLLNDWLGKIERLRAVGYENEIGGEIEIGVNNKD